MSDFKLDLETGDLDISSGLVVVEGSDEKLQRLRLAITINLGEWFADALIGVPYLNTQDPNIPTNTRYFFGDDNPNAQAYIQKTLDAYITNLNYIDSVESSISANPSTREFTYQYTAVTDTGDIVGDVFTDNI